MNPSPRVSVCRSGRQPVGKGVVSILQGRTPGARWAAGQVKSSIQQGRDSGGGWMPREITIAWGSSLVCGVGLSQQWSTTCLSYTLKVAYATPLGLFNKCRGTPDAKRGVYPGACLWVVPLRRHGCSDPCADILGVSPRQMCLL